MIMNTRKVVYLGLCLALALILSYVESLIPFGFGIPGIKLGLANIVILILVFQDMEKEGFAIQIARVLLAGFMFGSLSTIIYSLAGGILSFAVIILLKKINLFSIRGVSVAGGTAHNIGQLLAASFIVRTNVFSFYIPYLLISSIITGFLIGITGSIIIKRVKLNTFWSKEL